MWEEERNQEDFWIFLSEKMLFFSLKLVFFFWGGGTAVFYNSKSELPHTAMGISARKTEEAMGLES